MKKNIIFIFPLLLIIVLLLAERRDFRRQILGLSQSADALRVSNQDLKRSIAEHRRKLAEFETVLENSKKNGGKGTSLHLLIPLSVISLSLFIFFFMLKSRLSLLGKRLCAEIRESGHPPGPIQGGIPEGNLREKIFPQENHQKVEAETDHELPVKVGLEIHRMRKRIAHMPPGTKGRGALENALKRLEESLNDKGYELADLQGEPFAEGMTVRARFVPSDDLKPGEQMITKVIQPQISFKGSLIRPGEVEVGIGE